jgi:hypothetical protein
VKKAEKLPGDTAAIELARVAAELLADARRQPVERKLRGLPPMWLDAAGRALEALADGKDPRRLFDHRRRELPRLRAVDAVLEEYNGGARSRRDAISRASKRLGITFEQCQRHLLAHEKKQHASYLLPLRRKKIVTPT